MKDGRILEKRTSWCCAPGGKIVSLEACFFNPTSCVECLLQGTNDAILRYCNME